MVVRGKKECLCCSVFEWGTKNGLELSETGLKLFHNSTKTATTTKHLKVPNNGAITNSKTVIKNDTDGRGEGATENMVTVDVTCYVWQTGQNMF